MPYPRSKFAILSLIMLAALILWGCSTSTPAPDTQVVVTVVETIPVEVTRLVEVTQLVEVTKEVVVTEIVEIPVTVTPQAPTETPNGSAPTETPIPIVNTPALPTANPTLAPVSQFTPEGRGDGWLPFYIENQTDSKLGIVASGPIPFERLVWNGQTSLVWLNEGLYNYTVWEGGSQKYSGSFNITNIDKHKLFLREENAKFWYP